MIQDITEIHESVQDVLKEADTPTQEQTTPPQKEEVIEPEIIEEIEAEEEKEAAKGHQYDKDTINAMAETAIAFVNGVQTTIFTVLGEKKKRAKIKAIAGDGAISRLQQLKTATTDETTYTETDLKILDVDAAVEDYINQLDFDDNTKDMIREPMKMIVEKNMGKIPPEMMLFLGLANGIGKNIAGYYTL